MFQTLRFHTFRRRACVQSEVVVFIYALQYYAFALKIRI